MFCFEIERWQRAVFVISTIYIGLQQWLFRYENCIFDIWDMVIELFLTDHWASFVMQTWQLCTEPWMTETINREAESVKWQYELVTAAWWFDAQPSGAYSERKLARSSLLSFCTSLSLCLSLPFPMSLEIAKIFCICRPVCEKSEAKDRVWCAWWWYFNHFFCFMKI